MIFFLEFEIVPNKYIKKVIQNDVTRQTTTLHCPLNMKKLIATKHSYLQKAHDVVTEPVVPNRDLS